MPKNQLRSESTERAKALARANENLTSRAKGEPTQWDEPDIAQALKETGSYRRGGPVRKAKKKGK